MGNQDEGLDIRITRESFSPDKNSPSLSPRLQAAAVDYKEVFNANQLQASSPHVTLTSSTAHQTFTIMKSFFKKILIGCDNVICLEGFEIFSKERFIKISTHEIKRRRRRR